MPIRLLSETVAAQIAAGEVIERPASVVKELIENALDAGATRIEVAMQGAGTSLLRVTDDGHGIPANEAELALMRHATSKLSTVDDLYRIETLGFRGEALASIASVSHLTLTTRHRDEATGMRLLVEGGALHDATATGAPPGTTVEVRNLFYNVPARRKFMKTETTERRHVYQLLVRYALAYPHVRFALLNDDREAFRTAGSGNLADVIVETLGLEVFRDMLVVEPIPAHRADLPDIKVSGYVTSPQQTRANRSHITLFVNGRSIQDQRLTYAVVQAYHNILPQGRFPVAVLMLRMPPDEVDVNVHPTKAEVRFRAPDAVFSIVQRSVRRAVLEDSDETAMPPGGYTPPQRPWDDYGQRAEVPAGPVQMPRRVDPQQLGLDLEAGEGDGYQEPITSVPHTDEEFLRGIPSGPGAPERPRRLPPMRIVGQIAATYIIAEAPAGMYLIDQHAAHERILYDMFTEQRDNGGAVERYPLEGAVAELPSAISQQAEVHTALLLKLGFELEPFGQYTWRVRTVPALLADYDPQETLYRLLQDLDTEADLPPNEFFLRRMAKLAAVKAGQVLSQDEMLNLIRALERTDDPMHDPHGGPTLLHLSAADLAREFNRD